MSAEITRSPGFRRRVRERINGWTAAERTPEGRESDADPIAADAWSIHLQYRALLNQLGVEDGPGFAVWASHRLAETPTDRLRWPTDVAWLDDEGSTPAVDRLLAFFEDRADALVLTLPWDDDPALGEVYSAATARRVSLLERGYDEVHVATETDRPPGLVAIGRELFRDDAHERPKITTADGLTILGAPQGEGLALVVAREVRRRLDGGADPDDVLVVFRRWDEDAEILVDVLNAWDLPVSPLGRPRPLRTDPAVSALRQVCDLAADGWQCSSIATLLRHGRFRPSWPEVDSADAPTRAASAVVKTKVYRGRVPLRSALERAISEARPDPERIDEARRARVIVDRLIAEVEPLDQPATWRGHVARLKRVAGSFGLDGLGLESLWLALDDHAFVIDGLGRSAREFPFSRFVAGLDPLINDLADEDSSILSGSVVVTTLDRARGADAAHVLLVNLIEGTFPTRESVEALMTPEPSSRASSGYAREMARFLGLAGSARTSLTLAYPTRDEKGQDVLAAGFLDEVVRRIDPAVSSGVVEVHTRFDPTLIDRPDLAGGASDARVRAVALACAGGPTAELSRLAADPGHRDVLLAVAAALRLEHARSSRTRGFTVYEGELDHSGAVLAIADLFNSEVAFSPSQLETYLICPFRFFLRYVLKLDPIEEADDLDEDRTERGRRVHSALEELEKRRKLDALNVLTLDMIETTTEMTAELTVTSDTDPGRHEIERRWLMRTLERYAVQAGEYDAKSASKRPVPVSFEVEFGGDGKTFPYLVIGEGAGAVKLRGTIDRVDVLDGEGGPTFRVIDYKTGAAPSKKDVLDGLDALQLPLYASAVETLGIAGASSAIHDMGYWELGEAGYRPIWPEDWDSLVARVEAKVLETASDIRHAHFAVTPNSDDCMRTCDYQSVCRIRQVRAAKKGAEDESP